MCVYMCKSRCGSLGADGIDQRLVEDPLGINLRHAVEAQRRAGGLRRRRLAAVELGRPELRDGIRRETAVVQQQVADSDARFPICAKTRPEQRGVADLASTD